MIYTTRQGDSPYKIARKFGVQLADLIAANAHKDTTLVAGVRTWQSLQPGEVLSVPGGGESDVEVTAAALALLNADPNRCESVRHSGTPVNVAIHNFKRAWNASGQEFQLPIGIGRYEAITGRALAVVTGGAPPGCDAPRQRRGAEITATPITITGGDGDEYTETTGIGDGSATGLPGNTITGGFGTVPEFPDAPVVNMPPPPVVSAAASPVVTTDTLATVAAAAATALTADPNHCTSVGHAGSAVNTAVHAFKQAWNAANSGSKLPVGTGQYEASVAAALTSLLGTGVAPDGCGPTPTKHAAPPPPPPPAAVAVVAPASGVVPGGATAVTGTTVPPSPPVVAAMIPRIPPPPPPVAGHKPAPPFAPHRPAPPGATQARPAPPAFVPPSAAMVNASHGGSRPLDRRYDHRDHDYWRGFMPPPPPMDQVTYVNTTGTIPPPMDQSAYVNVQTPSDDSAVASTAPAVPPPPVAAPASNVQQAGLVPPASDPKKDDGVSTGMYIAGGAGILALVVVAAAVAMDKGKGAGVKRVSPTASDRKTVHVHRVKSRRKS